MDSIVHSIAIDFAKDFPQYVDHFEGDKPIFTEVGSIVFNYCVVKIVSAFIVKLIRPEV